MQSAEWYGIISTMHCVENLIVNLIDMGEKSNYYKGNFINDYIDHTKDARRKIKNERNKKR